MYRLHRWQPGAEGLSRGSSTRVSLGSNPIMTDNSGGFLRCDQSPGTVCLLEATDQAPIAAACVTTTTTEPKGLELTYADLGEQAVKNIARPVHVWRVVPNGAPAPVPLPRKYWRRGVLSLTGIEIAVGTFVVVQHVSPQAAAHIGFDSAAREPGAPPAGHTIHRGHAVHQPERRSAAGVFQRWHQRSADQRTLAAS